MAQRQENIDSAASQAVHGGRSWFRKLLRLLVAIPIGCAVLVVCLLMALEVDPIVDGVAKWSLRTFVPIENASIEVRRVGGGLLTGLVVDDLVIVSGTGHEMVRVPRANMNVHLLPLLSSRVSLGRVRVRQPRVQMRQLPDSTWDLISAFPADTTDKPSTPVFIGLLEVDNAAATLHFTGGSQDSTFEAWSVNAGARDIRLGGELRIKLDSLDALFRPPTARDTVKTSVRLAYAQRRLDLKRFSLVSAVSNVAGGGSIVFPGGGKVDEVDFRVDASPLAFRDIHPFLQFLNPAATVDLGITGKGDGSSIDLKADATFGDGSSLSATGHASPPGAGQVKYSVDALVRSLQLGYLLGVEQQSNPLSGELKGTVEGPSADSLSGDLRLAVEPFAYRKLTLGPVGAQVRFSDGRADFDASSSVNGSLVGLSGTGRPLDEIPVYRGQVRFANLNLARFGNPTQTTDLNGLVRFSGKGKTLETVTTTASVELTPSSWNRVAVGEARLNANINGPRVAIDLDARVGDGTVAGRGQLDVGEELTFTIRQLDVGGIPVAALMGDTLRSSVTGRLRGSGRGTDPLTMSLEAAASFSGSRYGSYEVISSDVEIGLRNGRVSLAGRAELQGGSATFAVKVQPFSRHPIYQIDELRFRSVDVAQLLGAQAWKTDLNGRLTGEVTVQDGESAASVSVLLDSSLVNTQFFTHARLDGSLSNGRLAGVFDAETPQGRAAAAATGRPFDETPVYQLTDGVFENIDLGAVTGRDRLRTALNGRFELDLNGVALDRLVARGRFDLAGSRFNEEAIKSGRLTISADSGRYVTQAFVEAESGSLEVEGTADLNGGEPFELTATMQNLNVAGLLGVDTLASYVTANFSASGSGWRENRTTGRGRLKLTESKYQDIEVGELSANLSVDGKLLRVDTLTALSNVLQVSGSGLVALATDPDLPASNLEVVAEIVDLKPLHSILPPAERLLAKGKISFQVSGEPNDVRFRADGTLTGIAYESLRIGAIDARVVGSLDENRSVASAESRIDISQLSLPTLAARTTTIEAAYSERRIRYEANSSLDTRRDVRTSGVVDLGADDVEVTMNTLRVRLDNDRWQLLQPSTITFGEEYRIRNFLLYSQTQQIAVDGYVDLDGEQSLIMTIEQFRMGGVADLFDYGGVDGTLNGYIDLTGPAAAPIVTGSLTADLVSLKRPVGDLSLDLSYSDLRLDIDGRLRNEKGSALTLSGHLPLDLRLAARSDEQGVAVRTAAAGGESKLTVRSDGFAIDWILPFLDPQLFNGIGGALSGQVDITGTFSDPELTGDATLTSGSVGLTEFGVRFTDLRGDFGFRGNQIIVNHLEARSGSGSAIVTGTISLSELTLGDFDLEISSEDFLAVDNREYRASAASDLRLTGSTRRPVLTGTVNTTAADIFLAEEIAEFESVRLSAEDLQTVEQRFGIRISEKDTTTFSFYDALTMDLRVALSRDTWLRSKKNPTMDIQFTGDLEVQKKPREFAQVFGTIEVIPERSRIVQFGKSFSIKRGTLTYNGPIDDPILDIQAEYDIRAWRNPENQVTITLTAKGRFDDLDVELSSDPTMEMTDIVSYIAFGRPASESLHLGGSGSGGALATDLALGQIAGLIEDVAGTGLGLDVIEIEQQGLDARLTAGKYVHRRVYLAISQPLNLGSGSSSAVSSTPEITAEFELLQSLLLRVLSRRSSISVNLLWQYAY